MITNEKWAVYDHLYTQISPELPDEPASYTWLNSERKSLTAKGLTRFHVKPFENPDLITDYRLTDEKKEESLFKWIKAKHNPEVRNVRKIHLTLMGARYSGVNYLRRTAGVGLQIFYVIGEPPERWLKNRNVLFHLNGQAAPEYAVWGHMPEALIGPNDLKRNPFGAYFVIGEWDARASTQYIYKDDAFRYTRFNFYVKDME